MSSPHKGVSTTRRRNRRRQPAARCRQACTALPAFDVDVVAVCEPQLDALSIPVSGLSAICGTSLPSCLRSALAFRTVVVATDPDSASEIELDRCTEDAFTWESPSATRSAEALATADRKRARASRDFWNVAQPDVIRKTADRAAKYRSACGFKIDVSSCAEDLEDGFLREASGIDSIIPKRGGHASNVG